MLAPMLETPARDSTMTLFILVIVSGFCTVIAMCRAGIQIFWAEADRHFPHARVTEISAIVLLLGLCLLLTVVVQAPLDYLHDAARQRSEERRGGKEGVSTFRSRWSPYH